MTRNFFILSFLVFYLVFQPVIVHACAACEGECSTGLVLDWKVLETKENGLMSKEAIKDAGLFIGAKGRELMQAMDYHKGIIEIINESGKESTEEIRIFLDAFREHINYIENDTVEIKYSIFPREPLHYQPRNKVYEETGAEMLISCKFMGNGIYFSRHEADIEQGKIFRNETIGKANFRTMVTALPENAPEMPVFIDEVKGKYYTVEEFIKKTEETRLMFREVQYDHFPGIIDYEKNINRTDEELEDTKTHEEINQSLVEELKKNVEANE